MLFRSVLVVEGSEENVESDNSHLLNLTIQEHMDYYLGNRLNQKDAMKKVALDRGISKREVYSYLHNKKETD